MTPDDTRKEDPGAAKTRANVLREGTVNQAEVVATQLDVLSAVQGPGWPNLGMTTQVLPGVAAAQSFNAAALSGAMGDPFRQ